MRTPYRTGNPFFNYRAIPNPDLKSESSDGFDIGIRWQGLDADFRLAAFRTTYQDFIESKVRVGTDPVSGRILFQSQNLNKTLIKGCRGRRPIRVWREHWTTSVLMVRSIIARGENVDTGAGLNSVGPGQAVIGATWAAADGRQQWRLQSTLNRGLDRPGRIRR